EIEDDEHPHCEVSTGERNFCKNCGAALWLYDPTWPDLVHPFASAIDSDLPKPPEKVHLMLKYKASWVEPAIGKNDKVFELYPEESIADWHKRTSSWVD
ncbi:MAG: GFA family protein, partial [Mesorhizobium sp.]